MLNKSNFSYFDFLFVMTIMLAAIVVTSSDQTNDKNATEVKSEDNLMVVSDKSVNGRSIKDNPNNSLEKSMRSDVKGNKDSIRKEKDMYDIMRLHQINANIDYNNKELKDNERKEKGKLQTVGGVFGEIIAVIVSEVVKLFGNMVSDVAREVTAHGFVSIFKQFTDLTGISIPENII